MPCVGCMLHNFFRNVPGGILTTMPVDAEIHGTALRQTFYNVGKNSAR